MLVSTHVLGFPRRPHRVLRVPARGDPPRGRRPSVSGDAVPLSPAPGETSASSPASLEGPPLTRHVSTHTPRPSSAPHADSPAAGPARFQPPPRRGPPRPRRCGADWPPRCWPPTRKPSPSAPDGVARAHFPRSSDSSARAGSPGVVRTTCPIVGRTRSRCMLPPPRSGGRLPRGPRGQMTGTAQPSERLDRSSSAPLWRQLLTDLGARLARDEFTDGFPGEIELVEQYAVSRHTVREALRQLRADGTISTGRGRRSRLGPAEPVIAHRRASSTRCSRPWSPAGSPRSRSCGPSTCAPTASSPPGSAWRSPPPSVYLERLRLAGGAPLALDRVWLPASIGEPLLTPTSAAPASTTSSPRPASGSPAARRRCAPSSPAGPSTACSACRRRAAAFSVDRTAPARRAGRVATHPRPRRPVRPHRGCRRRPRRAPGRGRRPPRPHPDIR